MFYIFVSPTKSCELNFSVIVIQLNMVFKILIVTVLFWYANASDIDEEYARLHDQCLLITGATEDQIKEVQNGNFIEDEKIMRYDLCTWIVSGVIDTKLNMDENSLDRFFPPEDKDLAEVYKECFEVGKNSGKEQPYEQIYGMEKCVYEKDPDRFDFV
ncbi:hypothetical protein JTB14_018103 [Gonioctena quinquepunctata]|nr:hypothetical protein JTB14_018103 [Gonioctena quinquepunctata]